MYKKTFILFHVTFFIAGLLLFTFPVETEALTNAECAASCIGDGSSEYTCGGFGTLSCSSAGGWTTIDNGNGTCYQTATCSQWTRSGTTFSNGSVVSGPFGTGCSCQYNGPSCQYTVPAGPGSNINTPSFVCGGGGATSCNNNGICESGENGSSCPNDCKIPPDPQVNYFSLSINPTTRSVLNGNSTTYTLTLTPDTNPSTGLPDVRAVGDYTLPSSIPGCPTGATCSYSGGNTITVTQDTTSGGVDFAVASSKTVVVAASTVTPNTYPLYISAVDYLGRSESVAADLIVTTGVNNASCSSITPSKTTVIAGEVFSATVTMQNNGTTVWSPNDMRNDVAGVNNYHVTVSPWAATWNYGRAAVSTNVAPGESFTFTVPLTAPATAGTYNLSTQMIQEGVQWFGALCNAGNITVSAVPAPTVTMTAPSEVQLNNPFIVSWTSTNAVSVIPGSSIVPPAGCTMSPAGALALNDSRTVTCTTVGSKYFQIAVMNGAGTQAIDGKAVNITAPAALTPPTNLSLSCSGGFVNASWNYTNGWSTYYLRANPAADDWTWPSVIQENVGVGSTFSFPAVVGQTYHVWVHTRNPADGSWSAAVDGNVFCPNTATTGTLTPPNPSCVIASGASSCTVNLSWSTTNPVGTSAITAVGMANVNGNSGTNVAFTVPYSSRIFYLYNNAVLLATSNATASCTGGTAWNGTVCAPTGGGGTSSVIGKVCKDNNGNGTCDAGEEYIRDTSISACSANPSSAQNGFSVSYSGPENGTRLLNVCGGLGDAIYSATSLPAGTYVASLNLPSGWVSTGCLQSSGGVYVACSSLNTGQVTVGVGSTQVILFAAQPPVAVNYSVTVNKTVGGTVTSTDGLINCGSTCSRQYAEGSTVTLQATPLSVQWRFAGWSGACTGTGNCVLTVDGNKSVTASFKPRSLLYQEF